jgi:CDP-diacylglycerol---glycerol-3-phosphate 3-phosphatidyltransferase
MIFTPSNILSCIRGPLAFLFIIDSPFYRTLAICLAMITDSLDGYLARKLRTTSQLGAVLDPIMDKFFVCFIIGIFLFEGSLLPWQAAAFLSRDMAVLIFGLYLTWKGKWPQVRFRSIWSGKITTTLQFLVLLCLTFRVVIPSFVYFCFMILGLLALIELYVTEPSFSSMPKNIKKEP